MYPRLNEMFRIEKKQPLYSDFIAKIEGVVYPVSVNLTAAEILRECNGKNNIDEIIAILCKKYPEEKYVEVKEMVEEFITTSVKAGYISVEKEPTILPQVEMVGSRRYWTPDAVSIELTHKCPLNCKHCYIDAGKGDDINVNTVFNLLDDCVNMGIEHVQLTGGEPLLHPDFCRIVEKIIELNLSVSIFTSGYINDSVIMECIKGWKNYKKISFQVSIDGLEDTHNDFRGKKDGFQRTISFVKNILSFGIRTNIGTCVSDQTFEELRNLGMMLKEYGVSMYRISPISNKGRAQKYIKNNDIEKMKRVKYYTECLAMELNSETFQVLFFEEGDAHINYKYRRNCGLGQTVIKIAPNGDVYPCLMSDIRYANIGKSSLYEIQQKYSRIWECIPTPSQQICGKCEKSIMCSNCVCEGMEYCENKNCEFFKEYKNLLQKIKEDDI